jgi:hypothetical protein
VKVGGRLLNLFYGEPNGDRWLPFDRYPRQVIRRLVRGRPSPGGQMRVFLNLCAGLDRLGIRYRVNDYQHAKRNPNELVCIIGKRCVLDKIDWENPILFGPAAYSHPLDDEKLFDRLPVQKVLVPGPWMVDMCRPYWGERVEAWPVGIDTQLWYPSAPEDKSIDVLLYDKVRWEHDRYEASLIEPIRVALARHRCSVRELRYGFYQEEEFHAALRMCRTMIFLCEHETQGIAYQQALSSDVPIFAWDRGGYWQDPAYHPHKVKFEPVTSVPYWDERCGMRFSDSQNFQMLWNEFWERAKVKCFRPRDYALENLTLEKCAREYVDIVQQLKVCN